MLIAVSHLFLVLLLMPFILIDEMERKLNKLTCFSDNTNIKLTDKLLGGFSPFQEAVDMKSLRVYSPIREKERDHQGLARKRKMRVLLMNHLLISTLMKMSMMSVRMIHQMNPLMKPQLIQLKLRMILLVLKITKTNISRS